jgi:hypothetical protein
VGPSPSFSSSLPPLSRQMWTSSGTMTPQAAHHLAHPRPLATSLLHPYPGSSRRRAHRGAGTMLSASHPRYCPCSSPLCPSPPLVCLPGSLPPHPRGRMEYNGEGSSFQPKCLAACTQQRHVSTRQGTCSTPAVAHGNAEASDVSNHQHLASSQAMVLPFFAICRDHW